MLEASHLKYLERCVELATEALEAGDEPFGSLLVSEQGTILFEDRNRVSGGDRTRHPEFEIARWAAAHMSPAERAAATVYTSGEHCAMCSAAHGWVGLGRIVYISSSRQLRQWREELGAPNPPVQAIPIREVIPGVEVIGPIPELAPKIRELHKRRHAQQHAGSPTHQETTMTAETKNVDYLALRARNVPRGVVAAHPICVDRASGVRVWDTSGREYLDFVGGIGVMNVGHTNPVVVDAVKRQVDRLQHFAFQVGTYDVYVQLAERLNTLVGKGQHYKSVFLSTGAEAVENAVKIARAYRNAPGIVAFRGGFHGRTLLGMSLTGMSAPYKQNFGPFASDVYHTVYPDPYRGIDAGTALRELDNLLGTSLPPERVAAVLIESVQGDGGFLYAGDDFLQGLRALTDKHGILLICDEIQAGFGRTGRLFGYEHSGIQPDIITVAKSLAAGFPLSGVVGKAEIMDAPTPGGLGGTYGGNPVACAAALAILDLFEEQNLLHRAEELGRQLQDGLRAMASKHPSIGTVRGLGPMCALEFVHDGDPFKPDAEMAQRVIEQARDRGLLVIKCGFHHNTVRLLAPLIATEADAAQALEILDQAVAHSAANK